MVNQITRMVSMETMWRLITLGGCHGKISLEIAWGFHGENTVNQISRRSPY